MKKVIAFFAAFFISHSAFANYHIVLVTPRGETAAETIYKEEVMKLLPNEQITFTSVKPNVNDPAEMSALPNTILKLKPDLICSWGTQATLAVAGTTT